ncbi:hypothetical protein [Micromonospora inositola]|uniref:Arsenate reductase n=1 Tax=Micromonospora inositola TaxID=47865 RepID=A0A1C5JQW2_9ACTN|nr:hypothetical protein [Micromonospora inositola]SCG72873.1 hypothetical protein GA0070613_5181 [Micromonospora inositola]
MSRDDEGWVPEACTLPTVRRPLRVAEFDELFRTALRGQRRLSPWELAGGAEAATRDLTARESACCSFFSFTVAHAAGGVRVDVRVPPAYVAVLDALADRAAAARSAS